MCTYNVKSGVWLQEDMNKTLIRLCSNGFCALHEITFLYYLVVIMPLKTNNNDDNDKIRQFCGAVM